VLRSLWDKLRGKQPEPPPETPSPHDPVIPFQTEEEKEVEQEKKQELLKKQREEEQPPPNVELNP
jgi:hypothetical protein